MVIASPRSTHRGLITVPTEWDDEQEHRRLLARALQQIQDIIRNLPVGVTSVSADYTMIDTDSIILVNATAAARTITLLSAAGRAGREVTIKKTDSSENLVTIDGNGSETLDGNATVSLYTKNGARTYKSDGTNWRLVSTLGHATGAI